MASEFMPVGPQFRIHVMGSEDAFLGLLDISSFLYDFNLLYEITRLASDPKYADFAFSRYALFRRGRPLEAQDRLYVEALSQGSPLTLLIVLAAVPVAIPAVYGLLQIVEKIIDMPLKHRKLKAEVEKLERENREAARRLQEVDFEHPEAFREFLRIREAEYYYDNVAGRLERSSVRIRDLEIEVVESVRRKDLE